VNCSESRTEINIIDRPQTNFEQIERHGVLHHQIGFFFYENSRVKLHSGDRQRVARGLERLKAPAEVQVGNDIPNIEAVRAI